MDKLLLGLALLSLAGNVWLALSWRKATSQALLADLYLKLLGVARKRNTASAQIIAEKETKIRELEDKLYEKAPTSELVDDLNSLFRGDSTLGGGAPSKLPKSK